MTNKNGKYVPFGVVAAYNPQRRMRDIAGCGLRARLPHCRNLREAVMAEQITEEALPSVDELMQRIAATYESLPRQLKSVATYIEQHRSSGGLCRIARHKSMSLLRRCSRLFRGQSLL